MSDLDLDPGDYRERKPKGWRWRLPLAHDDGSRLPFVMFLLAAIVLVAIFVTRDEGGRESLFGITAMFAFAGGIMFTLWLRD